MKLLHIILKILRDFRGFFYGIFLGILKNFFANFWRFFRDFLVIFWGFIDDFFVEPCKIVAAFARTASSFAANYANEQKLAGTIPESRLHFNSAAEATINWIRQDIAFHRMTQKTYAITSGRKRHTTHLTGILTSLTIPAAAIFFFLLPVSSRDIQKVNAVILCGLPSGSHSAGRRRKRKRNGTEQQRRRETGRSGRSGRGEEAQEEVKREKERRDDWSSFHSFSIDPRPRHQQNINTNSHLIQSFLIAFHIEFHPPAPRCILSNQSKSSHFIE